LEAIKAGLRAREELTAIHMSSVCRANQQYDSAQGVSGFSCPLRFDIHAQMIPPVKWVATFTISS